MHSSYSIISIAGLSVTVAEATRLKIIRDLLSSAAAEVKLRPGFAVMERQDRCAYQRGLQG